MRESERSNAVGPTKRASPTPYSERANWQQFAGPQKLRPAGSRLGAVIGLGLIGLFWNSFVVMFSFPEFQRRQWFHLLFMTPFILVGLGILGAFFYSFLKLFNPTIEIAISEGAVQLGESVDVAWELKGRTGRIKELVITAVAEEQATYTRGTDTRTDKSIFQSIEVARVSSASEMQFGTATLSIPGDSMHSHSGNKNKILWKLTVQGKISYFPDVHEEFEFRVIPRGIA